MPAAVLALISRPLAGALGLATRAEVGRVRSATGCVATIAEERARGLEHRLEAVEAELGTARAILAELYTGERQPARG